MFRILRISSLINKQFPLTEIAFVLMLGLCTCFAEDAKQSVLEILRKESRGENVDRATELGAFSESDKSEDVRWQSGQVLLAGDWTPIVEITDVKKTPSMKEYLKLRGNEKLGVDAHRKLAKWCQNKGLLEQSISHWYGVIDSSPEDAEARKAIGFEKVGSKWFSKDDLAKAAKVSGQRLLDYKVWMPKMQSFATAIGSSDTRKKSKAITELKSIDDPSAIQGLCMTAVQLQGDYARPFVQAIKNQKSAEACLALAKIAITNPDSVAAKEAMDGMKEYRHEFYVPELLALIEDDTELRQDVVGRPNGDMVLEQVLFRERSDGKSMKMIERIITLKADTMPNILMPRRTGAIGFATTALLSPESETARAVSSRDALRQAEKSSESVRQLNELHREQRQAVIHVLKATTGANAGETAQTWWNWWDKESEDNRISSKPYDLSYERNFDSIVYTRENPAYRIAQGQTSQPSQPSRECLVAGTSIQTLAGLHAVESIKIGDMVLSSDVGSGKIEFKPVLRTTVRPPAETMKIVTDEETIQATLGHYWWVSGHGWLRTKEIVAGMRLHTATGTALVESVALVADKAVTHNLIVADNHSYFVGRQRVLSNDASELKPTLLKVPGLHLSVARHSVP